MLDLTTSLLTSERAVIAPLGGRHTTADLR